MKKAFGCFQKQKSGYILCHIRSTEQGCKNIALRYRGAYVKHLSEINEAEKAGLRGFVAFSVQNPNNDQMVDNALNQILNSL